ncbi:hypothetical protein JVU11DRAFT_9732 [Chiua virens]|nr:hypothetical protein JVU11DRAFT_9732 [Chiua virens]
MEQRHARTNPPTGMARPNPSPSNMQTQDTRTTPSLDTIRRIRNSRGTSHRTRLIGISTEGDEAWQAPSSYHHHVASGEQIPATTPIPEPRHCQSSNRAQPESSEEMQDSGTVPAGNALTAEGIAKAVKATLRNLLSQTPHLLRTNKCSPRRRKAEDLDVAHERATEPSHHRDFVLKEVRELFKRKFNISQDADFLAINPALASDVDAFEKEDGDRPDPDNLAFDLRHSYNSPWNTDIIELLLKEFQGSAKEEQWPVQKSDNYVREILKNRYKKLRTAWFKGQPKLTQNGALETPEEVEARLVSELNKQGKESRQGTRRRNKYDRRVMTLDHITKLKSEMRADDVQVWEWLSRLIKTLSHHGMSSEESVVENDIEHVLRVKQMSWRRCIDKELEIIDTERLLDSDIFARQGAKPVKRIRAYDNPESRRDPVPGLPMAMYDSAWISSLPQRELDALDVSPDTFPWMKVATI